MRATKGLDYADPKYLSHSAGAAAQGIKWTDYHYAIPAGKKGDAVTQANFSFEATDGRSGSSPTTAPYRNPGVRGQG